MPVPTTFADLSTTIASNSPAGSDNVFPDLDNYIRALAGMLASVSANSGNGWTSPYLALAGGTVSGSTTFSGAVTLSGSVSGAALTNYLAAPAAIGGTTPAAGAFTTLSASSTVSGAGFSTYLASPPAIGGTAAAAGSFTTLSASGAVTLSGGTANGVLYLNGSKVATSGSALTFDGTTLGISGGITASSNVIVNGGSIQARNGIYTYFWNSDTTNNVTIQNPGATGAGNGAMAFGVSGTGEIMRLTSTGLGIGTTPGGKLDVAGLARAGGNATNRGDVVIQQSDNTAAGSGGLEFKADGANSGYGSRIKSLFNGVSAYDLGFQLRNNSASWSTLMLLDSSGNLGLGTTSPVNYGGTFTTLAINNSGAGVLDLMSGGVSQFRLFGNASENRLQGVTNVPMTFYTNNTERARIDSSGNLLVGTTDAAQTSGAGFKVGGAGGAGVGQVAIVDADSTNSTVTYRLYSTGAAAYRFYVGLGGTIYATSATITSLSDQRLKENIQNIDVGLNAIMALKPRKFDWKAGKGKDIKGDRGFIAQEFEQVFPDMVDTWQDPAPEGEEPYKAVNADLIPVLVKAIQELAARVAQLERQP